VESQKETIRKLEEEDDRNKKTIEKLKGDNAKLLQRRDSNGETAEFIGSLQEENAELR
jgi:hypothetical protein